MDRLPKKFEIRDLRNGDWAWVYKAVISDPHLSHADVRVYSVLASFDNKNDDIFPSYETIAINANVSRRKALESIKRLVDVGYIKIEKGGGRKLTNRYLLLKRPKGCIFCTVSKRVQKSTQKGAEINTKTVHSVHPINNNIYQDNNNNNNLLLSKDNNKLQDKNLADKNGLIVNKIIDEFKIINPSYKKFFANKTQRAAVGRLLQKMTAKQIITIIRSLKETNKKKYAPVITTPVQLEDKIASLMYFLQKEKNKGGYIEL